VPGIDLLPWKKIAFYFKLLIN